MDSVTPTIKGIFINSHVKRLAASRGKSSLAELEQRFGRPLRFENLKDYPVRDEVKIIELVLELLGQAPRDPEQLSFEGGRLHFLNFSTTPFGKILMSALPKSPEGFGTMLLKTGVIARHVFKNTKFKGERLGPMSLRITMENNDYPIEHFKGFFTEWMHFWGLKNTSVVAEETAPRRYEYTLSWE